VRHPPAPGPFSHTETGRRATGPLALPLLFLFPNLHGQNGNHAQRIGAGTGMLGALCFGRDQDMLALAAFEDAMGELAKPRHYAGSVHLRPAVRANRDGNGFIWGLGRFRGRFAQAILPYRAGAESSQSPGGCHWPPATAEYIPLMSGRRLNPEKGHIGKKADGKGPVPANAREFTPRRRSGAPLLVDLAKLSL
jgi:hypothetical protein